MYRAYRLGQLPFESRPEMEAAEFVAAAQEYLMVNYQYAWSLQGSETMAVAFGIAGRDAIQVVDTIWAPKISPRQKLETAIGLFDYMRKETVLMMNVSLNDKKFLERMVDYGLLRRVGTFFDIDNNRLVQFQTRVS
jgi:hypothetical protein